MNFDGGLTPGYYTLGSTAQIAQGNSSGVYATPTGDTSNYLSTGNSSITITPSSAYNYFGLYWGSLDDYNSISFKEANGTSVSYTGGQIAGFAGIPTDGATSVYVNFALTGTTFSSITLSSGQYAFESDNHAFGNIAAAPEPATWGVARGRHRVDSAWKAAPEAAKMIPVKSVGQFSRVTGLAISFRPCSPHTPCRKPRPTTLRKLARGPRQPWFSASQLPAATVRNIQ